jgi:plasmid maintenance system antidote protein VapI
LLYFFVMDTRKLLEAAIAAEGSEAKLAEKAGCSQVAINKAKKAGRVSPAMAVMLERATGTSRDVWCPDPWARPAKPQRAAA